MATSQELKDYLPIHIGNCLTNGDIDKLTQVAKEIEPKPGEVGESLAYFRDRFLAGTPPPPPLGSIKDRLTPDKAVKQGFTVQRIVESLNAMPGFAEACASDDRMAPKKMLERAWLLQFWNDDEEMEKWEEAHRDQIKRFGNPVLIANILTKSISQEGKSNKGGGSKKKEVKKEVTEELVTEEVKKNVKHIPLSVSEHSLHDNAKQEPFVYSSVAYIVDTGATLASYLYHAPNALCVNMTSTQKGIADEFGISCVRTVASTYQDALLWKGRKSSVFDSLVKKGVVNEKGGLLTELGCKATIPIAPERLFHYMEDVDIVHIVEWCKTNPPLSPMLDASFSMDVLCEEFKCPRDALMACFTSSDIIQFLADRSKGITYLMARTKRVLDLPDDAPHMSFAQTDDLLLAKYEKDEEDKLAKKARKRHLSSACPEKSAKQKTETLEEERMPYFVLPGLLTCETVVQKDGAMLTEVSHDDGHKEKVNECYKKEGMDMSVNQNHLGVGLGVGWANAPLVDDIAAMVQRCVLNFLCSVKSPDEIVMEDDIFDREEHAESEASDLTVLSNDMKRKLAMTFAEFKAGIDVARLTSRNYGFGDLQQSDLAALQRHIEEEEEEAAWNLLEAPH